MKKYNFTKEQLEELYINQKLSSLQIAEKLGVKHSRTIRKIMAKYQIPRRSLSEALTKKFKAKFDNDTTMYAFFLGLRAGDYYCKKKDFTIRIQTTSTHQGQIELTRRAFEKYGETKIYYSKNKARSDEWFIYVDLHKTFDFLLLKPEIIPEFILKNKNTFLNFLAAYVDCEGSIRVAKSHEKYARFIFDIGSGDEKILDQIKEKLESMRFCVNKYLDKPKGSVTPYGTYTKDIYSIIIYQKADILRLFTLLLPLSKHSEKIRKMKLILENKNKKWQEIKPKWDNLREEIKKEILQNCDDY